MTLNIFLTLCFCLTAIYGAFKRLRGLRALRAARKYKEALLTWGRHPISSFRHDTLSWITESIYWITVAGIGGMQLFVLIAYPLHPPDPIWIVISFFTILFSGYLWGGETFHPITDFFGGDSHPALSTEGLLYADSLYLWSAFSHFSFDAEKNIVRLWSSHLHGAVTFAFELPPEIASQVVEVLKTHLPHKNDASFASFLDQCVFPAIMGIFCAPFWILEFLSLQVSAEFAVLANGLFMCALMYIGGPVLIWLLWSKHIRPAPVE